LIWRKQQRTLRGRSILEEAIDIINIDYPVDFELDEICTLATEEIDQIRSRAEAEKKENTVAENIRKCLTNLTPSSLRRIKLLTVPSGWIGFNVDYRRSLQNTTTTATTNAN
jgi:hypothetical protein